jgi:hypothetical protein
MHGAPVMVNLTQVPNGRGTPETDHGNRQVKHNCAGERFRHRISTKTVVFFFPRLVGMTWCSYALLTSWALGKAPGVRIHL